MAHNMPFMPIPENALEAWSNGGSVGTLEGNEDNMSNEGTTGEERQRRPGGRGLAVNPITGQRRDMEAKADEGPPMTDDEKMREAERLFVLFERYKALISGFWYLVRGLNQIQITRYRRGQCRKSCDEIAPRGTL